MRPLKVCPYGWTTGGVMEIYREEHVRDADGTCGLLD